MGYCIFWRRWYFFFFLIFYFYSKIIAFLLLGEKLLACNCFPFDVFLSILFVWSVILFVFGTTILFVSMLVHIVCVDAYIFAIIVVEHALQSLMKFQLGNFFFDIAIHHIEFTGILMDVHVHLHCLLHLFSCFMSHAVVDVF